MKSGFLYTASLLLLAEAAHAQAPSLAGAWQGVETLADDPRYWPVVLRLQGTDNNLFGVLYQEVGGQDYITVNFQMKGTRTANSLQLTHVRKLSETGQTPNSYWCAGAITFTYDAAQEKLTGHATYRPVHDCDTGDFTFYRVKLKSAATVTAGALSTLRVSGRDVRWFADAELKQPVNTGNTYRTKLTKATTFYLTQGYYPSAESPVVPITIQVVGATKTRRSAPPAAPAPPPPPPPASVDSLPAAAPSAPPVAAVPPAPAAPAPVVLPKVLFKLGKAELLPESSPALDKLAADLRANPALRLRVAGHTDRIGEPGKNQVLSEQRATAVKAYLVKAGVAAARLETIGYGDSRPLYPSPDVRNRRVEVEQLP
ncbi:OmpA family protein [Hymenobacter setariae]|uniref:OmpA family protein n=1 Tax=Hymenobacter setariae TaxID=2594794 RepID=A0A558C294_9BACT|nr:OmpA family protein [Hymenobacter setariae]TVT42941.1 OmpA family protein [Hymenobacter setariae]